MGWQWRTRPCGADDRGSSRNGRGTGLEGAEVPHVEPSLAEPPARATTPVETSLDRWAVAVTGAVEASLVIDRDEVIVAMSRRCCELLGLSRPAVGRQLLGGVRLLDFGPGADE